MGIVTLGMIGRLFQSITEFGVNVIFAAMIKELDKKGKTKESTYEKINGYLFQNHEM